MPDTVEIPSFFQDNATASIHRHYWAGEWTLDIPDATHYEVFPRSSVWLALLFSEFQERFPWAQVRTADIVYNDAQSRQWDSRNQSLQDWLKTDTRQEICNGLDAQLDLALYWTGPAGELGLSMLPQAGRLIVDRINEREASSDFIIYPNVFTNTIHLLRRIGNRYDAQPFPFTKAAQKNRSMLETSLREWEGVTQGIISSWDSDLVSGVQRYGFAETATPFD
jgi:hypothetical protein